MRVVVHHKTTGLEAEEEVLRWEELQQLILEQLEQEEQEQLTILQLQDTLQLLMRAEEAEVVGQMLTLLVEQALELVEEHHPHQVPEETQLLKVAEVVEAELGVWLEEMVRLDL
jgi:hypothetical protein